MKCPHCGAVLKNSKSENCEYCGAVLQTASKQSSFVGDTSHTETFHEGHEMSPIAKRISIIAGISVFVIIMIVIIAGISGAFNGGKNYLPTERCEVSNFNYSINTATKTVSYSFSIRNKTNKKISHADVTINLYDNGSFRGFAEAIIENLVASETRLYSGTYTWSSTFYTITTCTVQSVWGYY